MYVCMDEWMDGCMLGYSMFTCRVRQHDRYKAYSNLVLGSFAVLWILLSSKSLYMVYSHLL